MAKVVLGTLFTFVFFLLTELTHAVDPDQSGRRMTLDALPHAQFEIKFGPRFNEIEVQPKKLPGKLGNDMKLYLFYDDHSGESIALKSTSSLEKKSLYRGVIHPSNLPYVSFQLEFSFGRGKSKKFVKSKRMNWPGKR